MTVALARACPEELPDAAELIGRHVGPRSGDLARGWFAELRAGAGVVRVEGGIGGLIDLRTHRPLDFKGFFASGSVLGRYSDLRDKFSPQVSGLVSTRWNAGGGEMGLLVSGVYQVRDYRSDVIGVGNPMARNASNFAACSTANPCAAGTALSLPNGTFEPLIVAKRTRIGADGMPVVVTAPDGTVGITIPSGIAIPDTDRTSTIKLGSGPKLAEGDTAFIQLASWTWPADGSGAAQQSSTWDSNPQVITLTAEGEQGLSQALLDDLVGLPVGSQLLSVRAPSGDSTDATVVVIDVLGIRPPSDTAK